MDYPDLRFSFEVIRDLADSDDREAHKVCVRLRERISDKARQSLDDVRLIALNVNYDGLEERLEELLNLVRELKEKEGPEEEEPDV